MKPKKLNKLLLNKKTIADLSTSEINKVYGGIENIPTYYTCVYTCFVTCRCGGGSGGICNPTELP